MRQIIILTLLISIITSCSAKHITLKGGSKLYKLIGNASTTDLAKILSCNYTLNFDKDGTEIWKTINTSNQTILLFFDKNNILKNYLVR